MMHTLPAVRRPPAASSSSTLYSRAYMALDDVTHGVVLAVVVAGQGVLHGLRHADAPAIVRATARTACLPANRPSCV